MEEADAEDPLVPVELEVRMVEKVLPAVPAAPVLLKDSQVRITLVHLLLVVTAAMVHQASCLRLRMIQTCTRLPAAPAVAVAEVVMPEAVVFTSGLETH